VEHRKIVSFNYHWRYLEMHDVFMTLIRYKNGYPF